MQIKSIVLVAACASASFAAPTFEERATGVCTSGINAELVPILAKAQAAQAFCASLYPVACTTSSPASTTTTTGASAKVTGGLNIFGNLGNLGNLINFNPFKVSTSTSTSLDLNAWFKLLRQPTNTISTFCSCIQTPKTCST